MRILFDTNIILDFIIKREPFSDNANALIELCDTGVIEGCIAAHTIPDVFYILRKQLTVSERKNILLSLCEVMSIVGLDSLILLSALKNEDFTDFEDCLQNECAMKFNADYIVTRDPIGFLNAKIPIINPVDLLKLLLPDSPI